MKIKSVLQFMTNRQFGAGLSRFFDQICCINLDSRPDRWSYIQKQFDRYGLKEKVVRFSAIDLRANEDLWHLENLQQGKFSVLANCGCILSHRSIVQNAKSAGLRNILVFEDDVEFLTSNIGTLKQSLSSLSELEWDVFYLGATYQKRLEKVGRYLVRVPQGAAATHAIAYNHSFYDKFLETIPESPVDCITSNNEKVNAIDTWLRSDVFNHDRFFGTNPIMAVQGLQESDISMNQMSDIRGRQIALFMKNIGADN